jgi:hypothetical protein
MNSSACEQPGKPFIRTRDEQVERGETAVQVLRLINSYTIESTGQPLEIYKTAAVEAGTCIQVDEFEISVSERLSQDEVAQCIFAICGGDLQKADAVGETSKHWVHYSRDMKGLLGLSPKASVNP